MTQAERERLDLYNSLTDAEAADMDDSDIADYEALSAMAQSQPQEAPNGMQEVDKAKAQAPVKAGQSKVVPAAQGAVSKAIDWIAPKIETANEMSRAWPQFVANTISPNVGELAEQQGDDFSLLSTDYLKAAGKDLLRAAPLATSAIGAPVAGLGALGRAGYMGLRGALESSGFAGLENLLRPENEQISTVDAAALGGVLGGGLSGGADLVGAGLSKTIPRIREFMANRAGVSPEALQAYSTPEGRALIAGAFGQEDRIAKDLLDIASPKYMEYMPETQVFNELVWQMKGPSRLSQFEPLTQYNPTAKSGGEHLLSNEQRALGEIQSNYIPLLRSNNPAGAQGPEIDYRVVNPAQLNDLRKRLGRELDDAWNQIERGVPSEAVKVGKDLYRGMREELLAIAEREGMDEAKNLLKAQAKKLEAREKFLESWTGNTTNKQKSELRIRKNIAGVMQKPSIDKIEKMEKLSELDRAIGTSFAPDVTSASYARELASESARPGRYSASIIPKLQTGKAGTGVLSAIGLPLIGGSPVTGAGYLANLNALENMAQGAAGAQLPVASAVIPFLREYR